MNVDVADPQHKGKTFKVSLYEAMALGQMKAAMKGNTHAWKEIQDTLFGKQTLKVNLGPEDLQNLTDEELDDLIAQLSR